MDARARGLPRCFSVFAVRLAPRLAERSLRSVALRLNVSRNVRRSCAPRRGVQGTGGFSAMVASYVPPDYQQAGVDFCAIGLSTNITWSVSECLRARSAQSGGGRQRRAGPAPGSRCDLEPLQVGRPGSPQPWAAAPCRAALDGTPRDSAPSPLNRSLHGCPPPWLRAGRAQPGQRQRAAARVHGDEQRRAAALFGAGLRRAGHARLVRRERGRAGRAGGRGGRPGREANGAGLERGRARDR